MKAAKVIKISISLCLILILTGLKVNAQNPKDYDGNVYRTASYGMQVWTANNLKVAHFRNGDIIPEAKTDEEWANAAKNGTPAWCYYENDPMNGIKYGKLYNWFAIDDPRGLAPEGWHLSSNSDWRVLIKNLKGVDIAGTKLKSTSEWKSRKGTNEIGFNAVPGGCREPDGKFRDLGVIGQWWSNSVPVGPKPSNKIFSLVLSDTSVEVKYVQSEKGAGLSVRCEKD